MLALYLTWNIIHLIDNQIQVCYNDFERGEPMKYYGYVRVSTDTQAEKGFGLEEQRREILAYAKEKGYTVECILADEGISGAIKDTESDEAINKRAGLIELLGTIEDGDGVIVANTSRLWRSDNTKVLIRRELMRRRCKLISVQQPQYDLYATNPNDRLVSGLMELLDEWERLSIALKLARGRTMKAKGGDKPSGVCPIGYRYSEDKKRVVVVPDEAEVVRAIFTEGQKGLSLREIADIINAKGYKTRRGNAWGHGSIQAVLANRFYIGELSHQGKPIKGNHEPLISRVQFGKCQAQLEKRKRG